MDKLKVGNKVYILDDKGDTLAFIVKSVSSFDRNADSTPVFTSHDGLAHLNLITCEGIWNQVNGNYPERLVVFTDAIPGEGAVVVNAKSPAVAKAKLPSTAIIPTPTPLALVIPTPVPSFIQNTRSLYDNPIDTLISSLLIISIIFISVKIIKR